MASFLPLLFPGGAASAIPGYDAAYEQRCKYPYTYTSIKTLDDGTTAHEGRGAAQGTFGAIRFQKRQVEQRRDERMRDERMRDERSAPAPPPPKTLAGLLIRQMDPLAALYSPEWMAEIEQEFRDTLRSFLAEDSVASVLGKTRCRDCLYYFEKPRVKPSKSRMASLGSFLSFWWGTPVQLGDKVYAWKMTKEQKASAKQVPVFTHLDDETWVLT